MTFYHISIGLTGICFTSLGIIMRKQQKKDWRAFLVGGIVMLAAVILSLVFGFSL